jgi:hypothetical protein
MPGPAKSEEAVMKKSNYRRAMIYVFVMVLFVWVGWAFLNLGEGMGKPGLAGIGLAFCLIAAGLSARYSYAHLLLVCLDCHRDFTPGEKHCVRRCRKGAVTMRCCVSCRPRLPVALKDDFKEEIFND